MMYLKNCDETKTYNQKIHLSTVRNFQIRVSAQIVWPVARKLIEHSVAIEQFTINIQQFTVVTLDNVCMQTEETNDSR